MKKIDFKKTWKALYYVSARKVVEVEVPALRYMMIDGEGNPNLVPAYREAVEALFSVSYTAKFMVKKSGTGVDYAVMPLEGLWWADDLAAFEAQDKSKWKWTMMILQPEPATDAVLERAMEDVSRKKKLPGVERLRLETFTEGRCAQILHVGPFAEEGPTIERVHAHIAARGNLRGKHHEIYLSDIRRAASEKWKTIIRQPMTIADIKGHS